MNEVVWSHECVECHELYNGSVGSCYVCPGAEVVELPEPVVA